MRRSSVLLSAFLVVAMSACATQPVADSYYSLVLAADDAAAPARATAIAPTVIVGPIELPSYLDTRGIAIQSGPNQIRTASHHFWAESLDEEIAKVLVRDISQLSNGVAVERDFGRRSDAVNCRLRFDFDKFHATSWSSVVASGRYWLSSDEFTIVGEFNRARTLTKDGYSNSVTELREILLEVAQIVAETLQQVPGYAPLLVFVALVGGTIGALFGSRHLPVATILKAMSLMLVSATASASSAEPLANRNGTKMTSAPALIAQMIPWAAAA